MVNDQNNGRRNWIIVASRDHVLQGVREGIAQASHGKQTALRRMKKDDNIIYYSPKTIYGQNEKCQKFTAIGKIKDNDIFLKELAKNTGKSLKQLKKDTERQLFLTPSQAVEYGIVDKVV